MHASSVENLIKCVQRYASTMTAQGRKIVVLDVGGAEVNGSYRSIFEGQNYEYITADLEKSDGVDLHLIDPYRIPMPDGAVDIVISGQMLEHCEFFWLSFAEMIRVLDPQGYLFLIAPSQGPIHRFPVDCYRFYPDAYLALAKYVNCHLVDCWLDERGPWHDLVGVFSKYYSLDSINNQVSSVRVSTEKVLPEIASGSSDQELCSGSPVYLDFLKSLHLLLKPDFYLEIGIRHGQSLKLASCQAIGVDPFPDITVTLGPKVKIINSTSDDFFEENVLKKVEKSPDLVFIDGMHLFEFALRDFMHVERHSSPSTVVVIDDIFPNHPIQASRERKTKVWTGDVWKLMHCLATHRPDLTIVSLDVYPTGMLLVAGLDSNNRTLWEKYNPIVGHYKKDSPPPVDILKRDNATSADSSELRALIEHLRALKLANASLPEVRKILSSWKAPNATLVSKELPLSVIVVAYEMDRELPRTILSLSPVMQREISAGDYEVIVVDNGSSNPVLVENLNGWGCNIKVHRVHTPSPSPVSAVNQGLALAKGQLIGVCIDGARMVSPGLLANALRASKLSERTLIGTIGFHLGPDLQQRSITEGYSKFREDELLESVDWTSDGYKLFDIAAFAGSSEDGWFAPLAESNATFMPHVLWDQLGGFDTRFCSPGGGLVNLDVWQRACELDDIQVIVLLGEGTFHQLHGGISTNTTENVWTKFHEEYLRIRGEPFVKPSTEPLYIGRLKESALKSIAWSAKRQLELLVQKS